MKLRKKSASFQREKPPAAKEKSMNGRAKTEAVGARPSASQDPELDALLRLADEDIDTSDIPEITDWRKAVVGKFYRPIKNSITIRLDADVLSWLKRSGPGYQTRINALLRQAMHRPLVGSHQSMKRRTKKPS